MWWQRRSWRMDLAVLARVRDGLRGLEAPPDGHPPDGRAPVGHPPGGHPPDGRAPHGHPPDGRAPTSQPPAEAGNTGDTHNTADTYNTGNTHNAAATTAAPSAAVPCRPETPSAGVPCRPETPPAQDEPADALPDSALVSVRNTFTVVAAAGDKAASFFYGRLFASNPQLRGMFPPAMDQQRDRLFRAFTRIVDGLSSPDDLASYLSQLGRDHRKYSVEPAMYDALGEALIATLRAYAGPAFTQDAEQAWVQTYRAISSLMIRAAEEDGADAPAYWTAEVVGNERRRPGISVLTVAPDQPFPYLAGQHVTVQTPRWPRVWRPYSVASRPREDGLMTFHVRAVPGGWVSSALVHYTAPGDELLLGPALGTMTLGHAEQRDLLCVAGGTGLSPIKAIIEQAIRESSACPRQIFLFYGARTREELYDLPDLYRLMDAYPRFLLTPVTSDDPAFDGMQGNVGRVAARYLPHRECEAYVAGPPAMVRETIRVLVKAGVPQCRIHYDGALLSADQHASLPRARSQAVRTDALAVAPVTEPGGDAPQDRARPGAAGEPACPEPIPAAVLAGRHTAGGLR